MRMKLRKLYKAEMRKRSLWQMAG